jgi:hypothetical protein
MKPLLIFAVLAFLGAMFLIGDNPEKHEVKKESTTSAAQTIDQHTANENEHIGEE